MDVLCVGHKLRYIMDLKIKGREGKQAATKSEKGVSKAMPRLFALKSIGDAE